MIYWQFYISFLITLIFRNEGYEYQQSVQFLIEIEHFLNTVIKSSQIEMADYFYFKPICSCIFITIYKYDNLEIKLLFY